jgi:hypothetical protein
MADNDQDKDNAPATPAAPAPIDRGGRDEDTQPNRFRGGRDDETKPNIIRRTDEYKDKGKR